MNQNLQRVRWNLRSMMRVRSQSPGFWRVLAFDEYTGQGWDMSRPNEIELFKRSSVSFRTRLPAAANRIVRYNTEGREREIVQTYTVVNNLPNLIPALYQADDLYFPTREVAIDADGSLRSPIPLSPGDHLHCRVGCALSRSHPVAGRISQL
jgi:hypothetical protein